jgi:hypothetical protein
LPVLPACAIWPLSLAICAATVLTLLTVLPICWLTWVDCWLSCWPSVLNTLASEDALPSAACRTEDELGEFATLLKPL